MMKNVPFLVFFFALAHVSLTAQQLVSSEYRGERSLLQMQADFGFLMQNGIEMYKLTYTTPDINGQLDTASGLIVIPVPEEGTFAYPLLCYQHGTVSSKDDVPSELAGGWELAAVWSGLQYVAVAPDYLGLGESRGFHPYVHAETEASAAIDMMRAARQFMEGYSAAQINDQVFVTGYSQGGHAAAALQRELEQNLSGEFPVTASAPMSGPYSISGEMLKLLLSDEPYFYPSYLPYTALSYNEAYGLYADIEDYFKQPYAAAIEEFYNGERDLNSLNTFLITELTANEGASITRFMMQDSLVAVLESNDASHPIIQALQDNDVYDWTPQAPTRLIYCTADDQVVYTNSLVADSVMNANGAADVMAVDVGPTLDHGACVQPAVIEAAGFFQPLKSVTVNSEEVPWTAVNSVQIAPNPASEQVQLNGLPAAAYISLVSPDGRRLQEWRTDSPQATLSLNNHPAGLYYLRIDSGAHSQLQKLILR